MKHLFLQANIKTNKLPIFFELRELTTKQTDIVQLIREKLLNNELDISISNIQMMIKHGDFILFFDGFDELNYEFRNELLSQLVLLKKNNLNTDIIISSRHDDMLFSKDSVTVMEIAPFNTIKPASS